MPYDLLSEPIKRFIRDKRWEQLRPIQAAAISKILTTNDNYILASKTASGKTEAAFLPILSKVDFNSSGIQVLYISPLIALINDQFIRIQELCRYLDISITKWHGEANRSAKEQILKSPNGIILITPESLEAMFVNKPYNVKHLFSNLRFIVIDEIHSFLGADRGIQLKSLISRLQSFTNNIPTIIGLSATIGDFEEAKKFTGRELNTKVLLDKGAKDIDANFVFFESEGAELPLDLLKDVYRRTKDHKALIFPNSRGRAEEVAVKLKKISDKINGHGNYFSHHSSVHKELREFIEHFAKNNIRNNFSICCTSTLELGIDIGTVDKVIQIDAPHSIASLIQRIGRSGRREGERSSLILYATDKWNLLQSIATWLLYKDKFIEPIALNEKPYDILLHQILSTVKGTSGISVSLLIEQLSGNFAFKIEASEIAEVVENLIEIDFLEFLNGEVIIGVEGEWTVNNREFYSVFKSEETFKVVNAGNAIGEIPLSLQIREDENILLAAKIWKIVHVDFKAKKIEVTKANDGKKPTFFGSGGTIHPKIRERMLQIIYSNDQYDFLDEKSADELEVVRKEFRGFAIKAPERQRPLLRKEQGLTFHTFSGTLINRTIAFLFEILGVETTIDEQSSSIFFNISYDEFYETWKRLNDSIPVIDSHIQKKLFLNPAIIEFSKWGKFLPVHFQVELLKQKYFDFSNCEAFVREVDLIVNV